LHTITDLDIVLDDMCRMDFIQFFPNMKTLTLINQGISDMEGMDKLHFLEQVWLNENLIENIKGLEKSVARSLRELYLGNNRIKRIRGLDALVNLEKLWLDENRIESISETGGGSNGLNNLVRLRELNLASNRIESIGMSLDGLVSLEELNISNNKIGNFKEVLNLNRLPNLRICTFQDPHYGENPICNLCNYQTYVLYHLPNLTKLDTLYISDDAKAFADATFMKKRMYYNMRIKTIQRNASNIMKLLKVCKKIRNFKIDIQVTKLTKKLNEISREIEERQYLQ
jgi:Leucine-rich repeat (LRR) protein